MCAHPSESSGLLADHTACERHLFSVLPAPGVWYNFSYTAMNDSIPAGYVLHVGFWNITLVIKIANYHVWDNHLTGSDYQSVGE